MDVMTAPTSARIMDAVDATWPPAEITVRDGWCLRRGAGGGKRVSAASAAPGGDVAAAEAAMRAWDQQPMFRLIPGEDALDADLAARGYALVDPVALYAAPAGALAAPAPKGQSVYHAKIRPALMEEIWAEGGIGPARLDVMDRAVGARMFLMARLGDRPCGAAFVALDGDVAMIHAIEVQPAMRRQGAARLMIEAAAAFAQAQGAHWLTLAVTEANAPARALYERLGMTVAGNYHYRVAPGA